MLRRPESYSLLYLQYNLDCRTLNLKCENGEAASDYATPFTAITVEIEAFGVAPWKAEMLGLAPDGWNFMQTPLVQTLFYSLSHCATVR